MVLMDLTQETEEAVVEMEDPAELGALLALEVLGVGVETLVLAEIVKVVQVDLVAAGVVMEVHQEDLLLDIIESSLSQIQVFSKDQHKIIKEFHKNI
jgi:hypothetical protein